MDEINKQTIEGLLGSSDSELHEYLGATLDLELGVHDRRPEAKKARKWMESNRQRLRSAICKSTVVAVYLSSEKASDRVLLVAAIIDLISGIISGIAAMVVAVMLVKEGLSSFCSDLVPP